MYKKMHFFQYRGSNSRKYCQFRKFVRHFVEKTTPGGNYCKNEIFFTKYEQFTGFPIYTQKTANSDAQIPLKLEKVSHTGCARIKHPFFEKKIQKKR